MHVVHKLSRFNIATLETRLHGAKTTLAAIALSKTILKLQYA